MMGWLNRLAARQIIRTQRIILARIAVHDKAIELCDKQDRWGEVAGWKLGRSRLVRRFHELQTRLEERLEREKGR